MQNCMTSFTSYGSTRHRLGSCSKDIKMELHEAGYNCRASHYSNKVEGTSNGQHIHMTKSHMYMRLRNNLSLLLF